MAPKAASSAPTTRSGLRVTDEIQVQSLLAEALNLSVASQWMPPTRDRLRRLLKVALAYVD